MCVYLRMDSEHDLILWYMYLCAHTHTQRCGDTWRHVERVAGDAGEILSVCNAVWSATGGFCALRLSLSPTDRTASPCRVVTWNCSRRWNLKLLDLVCNGLQNFLLNFLFFDNCVLGYFLHTNTTLLSPPPVLPMSSFFKELFIFGFARILHIDFQKGRGKVMM